MRLIEFGISGGPGFKKNKRIVSRRCLHVAEAITYELLLRAPIQAPFKRIEISLYNVNAASMEKKVVDYGREFGSFIEVRVGTTEAIIFAEYAVFRTMINQLIEEALEELRKNVRWSSDVLNRIVDEIADREKVFHYHFKTLSKIDPITQNQIDVYFDMTEDESEIVVDIRDRDGNFIQRVPVLSSQPSILDGFFPMTSTSIENERLLFYNSRNDIIAVISLRD